MTVDVLIPWSNGCEQRARLLAWTMAQYGDRYPGWKIILGASPPGPFNRAAAILAAAAKSSAEVLVVSDADVWCNPLPACEAIAAGAPWAVPHTLIHRLSEGSTEKVLHGADWRGLPLSTDCAQDSKPYKGNETGTLFVIRRDVLFDVPPDIRFVGWGQEDEAHAAALNTLVGKPWRGTDDLVHCWHPPQPRQSRRVGNGASMALARRYRNARNRLVVMRELVEESKGVAA